MNADAQLQIGSLSGGFLLARASAPPADFPVTAVGRAGMPAVAVVSEKQLDASRVALDLSGNPRLLNVAFRPSEGDGRLSISFDVTTRYNVSGRAEDRSVAALLAYVVNAGAATEGARGRAIDLVSRELGERAAALTMSAVSFAVGARPSTRTTLQRPSA